jgi:hypothetical protein
MEDRGFECYTMAFDPFGAEEEQGANQTGDERRDPMELEISAQRLQAPTEFTPISTIPALASMTEVMSLSTDDSPGVQFDERQSSNEVQSSSASNDTESREWLCNFPNCRKSFTHRHKLKFVHDVHETFVHQLICSSRHTKYHIKPHQCLDPSCATRRVALSLEKDLIRHQSKHNGRRFYCHHVGCSYAITGTEGGFTRNDNLKRHLTNRH